MNGFARARAVQLSLAFGLLSGCSGNVNLGGKGTDTSANDEAAPVSTNPNAAGESVVTINQTSIFDLAVAGDFLYFSQAGDLPRTGLYRCRKSDCQATVEGLLKAEVGRLQLFGERLGVATWTTGNVWLGSYALPAASDEQIAIRDLPGQNLISSYFSHGFVYFLLLVDAGIYRCALPNCPAGPELLSHTGGIRSNFEIRADAERVFWSDKSFIYRAADYGRKPAQRLLPDELLSEAPSTPDPEDAEEGPKERVESITAGDGAVYAVISHSETGGPCNYLDQILAEGQIGAPCPHRLVRWPSDGGPSETLLSSNSYLGSLELFDGELTWLGPSLRSPTNSVAATISTCRVEACEATKRDLGEGREDSPALVADDSHVYWLENVFSSSTTSGGTIDTGSTINEIRRAPRLPRPDL